MLHDLYFNIGDVKCYFCPESATSGTVVVVDCVDTFKKMHSVKDTLCMSRLGTVVYVGIHAELPVFGLKMTGVNVNELEDFLRRQNSNES